MDKLRFKRIDYTYDLISGNVLQVAYQPGEYDRFYHRYKYDADNRIISTLTSKDGKIWDTDARYNYYHHGPLARTELGQAQVQGIDYAYTLQGWLKSMNASTLSKNRDMGKDGQGQHTNFARDVYATSLHYFDDDYASISETNTEPAQRAIINSPLSILNSNELYNGNISSITNSFWNNTETTVPTQANKYTYDQLNRLTKVDVFRKQNGATDEFQITNNWQGASSTVDYQTRLSYDANGNILTLKRNAWEATTNSEMDDMTYEYYANTNQLKRVTDAVTPTGDYDDINTQPLSNYTYDAIGNLVKDQSEKISEIRWRVDGKISDIIREGGTAPNLSFEYDAMGNRITKIAKPQSSGVEQGQDQWTYTHYVRDASGNPMAVYTESFEACSSCTGTGTTHLATVALSEHNLYGSDRLGIAKGQGAQTYEATSDLINGVTMLEARDVFTDAITTPNYNAREDGSKVYELKNHLGNVYNTIADYKIWKTATDEETVLAHTFEDAAEVALWTATTNASTALGTNNELEVSYTAIAAGVSKTIAVNTNCTYDLCLDLTTASPLDITLTITDENQNEVYTDNISTIAQHCYTLSNLANFDTETITIWLTANQGSGSFTVDNINLTSQCGTAEWVADVLSAQDYYAFGMLQPGRTFSGGDYRYGFNGMEKDDEIKGNGNTYNFGARIYDNRIGKWFSKDRVIKSHLSPYQFARANPIIFIDPDGNDEFYFNENDGTWDVIPTDGDHVFFVQSGDGYSQLLVKFNEMSFGEGVGQFFLAMLDASDLNRLSDFVSEHKDLQEYMSKRGTTEFNKKLPKLLKRYNASIKTLNTAETVIDIVTTAGEAKVIKSTLKKGARIFVKKFSRNIIKLCFVKGTIVLTSEGAKNIEDLKIGDEVFSFNEETLKVDPKKIVDLFVNEVDNLIIIESSDSEVIVCTPDHLFYLDRNTNSQITNANGDLKFPNQWVPAKDIEIGDNLLDIEGNLHSVILIRKLDTSDVKVYNIEVEDNHTYFVTYKGILTHNHCTPKLQRVFDDWLTKGVHADIGPGEIIYDLNETGELIVRIFDQGKRNIPKKVKKAMIKDGKAALDNKEFRDKMVKKIDDAIELGKGKGSENDMAQRGIEKLQKIKDAVQKLDNN